MMNGEVTSMAGRARTERKNEAVGATRDGDGG